MKSEPVLSLVIPFFNEKENVAPVCLEIKEVVRSLLPGAEVILIDDGSDDGTAEELERVGGDLPQWRIYHLEQNQGQAAALLFGLGKALAPVIVIMDGDGQNNPYDIPRLLGRLRAADMVVGIRMARQDSWARRKISRAANLIRARVLGDGVSDAGCALKAFRREVVSAFIPIQTLYSFMPALAVAAGFRVAEEPVTHRPRVREQSKYPVHSFLFLPLIDFIGLQWFRARRCPKQPARHDYPDVLDSLGAELYRRSMRQSRRRVALALGLALIAGLVLWSRGQASRPADPPTQLDAASGSATGTRFESTNKAAQKRAENERLLKAKNTRPR